MCSRDRSELMICQVMLGTATIVAWRGQVCMAMETEQEIRLQAERWWW